MGEHAVVYGRPALVVALGLTTRVEARALPPASGAAAPATTARLRLRDLEIDETVSWTDVVAHGDAARDAWERFAGGDDDGRLDAIRSDAAHHVKTALAETVRVLGVESDALPSVEIDLESEVPLGAGFGSSASVAVAVSGALLAMLVGEVDPALVDRIALETERRQHGRPSGVDHATVLSGGAVWADREGEALRCTPIDLAPGALDGFRVFHTGTPRQSTGAMVEAVRRRFAERPGELDRRLAAMESSVRAFRDRLSGGSTTTDVATGELELIRSFERDLEALGVVPEAVRQTIRQIESLGAAAKISGAGGLGGPEAGSLLAYDPEGVLAQAECVAELVRFDVPLGGPGLRVEDLA